MNDRERPRILAWVQEDGNAKKFDWVEERSGTFRRIRELSQVDLDEWDVIVTEGAHAKIGTNQFGLDRTRWERVPEHLFVFRVFSARDAYHERHFEFNLTEDDEVDTERALWAEGNIAGHKMERASGLPEPIQDLVKTELMSSLELRSKQFGIMRSPGDLEPAILRLRPFLYGPAGLVMAASYERPGGRSVWLVPNDAINIPAWFDVAMHEWHRADPRTFPSVTTWQTSPMWDTADELRARAKLGKLQADFARQAGIFEKAQAEAQAELTLAAQLAIDGPKSLLTAQDDPLQDAALIALRHLGFEVEDMDLVWPERERREDYRIRDAGQPEWIVLADATGVARGAPGSKITTVVGYVTKYILEERAEAAPGVWIIVNRLFHRDPMTRGDVYRGDDLAVLESHEGLAIDSAALFLLTQDIATGSERAAACRAWLRARCGQVTAQDAVDWLAQNV